MARTKASVGAKISSGKSSKARCSVAPTTSTGTSSGGSDKSSRGSGGGNPVCPRDTPKWQKPITNFLLNKHNDSDETNGDGEAAGSSKQKPKPRRNIIDSDDDTSPEKPKNNALDETIELEELTGDHSHKIEEYYPIGAKGKGVGKKTKEIKNADTNSVSDTEDLVENDEKETEETVKGNGAKEKGNIVNNGGRTDKENIDINMEKDGKVARDVDSSNVGRNKRERDDRIEEGNVSKKIKHN